MACNVSLLSGNTCHGASLSYFGGGQVGGVRDVADASRLCHQNSTHTEVGLGFGGWELGKFVSWYSLEDVESSMK